jgi:hypothetical protein
LPPDLDHPGSGDRVRPEQHGPLRPPSTSSPAASSLCAAPQLTVAAGKRATLYASPANCWAWPAPTRCAEPTAEHPRPRTAPGFASAG